MSLVGMSVEELLALGLDAHELRVHQERIQHTASRRGELFIPIHDTCRLDNQGILPARYLRPEEDEGEPDGFVAFVPAAGAASRYFKPLHALRHALDREDRQAIAQQLAVLREEGARGWPLPPHLAEALQDEGATDWSGAACRRMLAEIDLPKALLPAWKEGVSFLMTKQIEHQALRGVKAQVFVAPHGGSEAFRTHLADGKAPLPTLLLEQGPSMSTLRFLPNGEPYRDSERQLSLVPAGHGMLVKLFPDISKAFPEAHSLLIRNIDNVNGTAPEAKAATELFLTQHQSVLSSMRTIRRALHADQLEEAAQSARALLARFLSRRHDSQQRSWLREIEEPWLPLWEVLLQILHCPLPHAMRQRTLHQDKRALRELFDRPLNTLGQVPNSGKDIGGSPVFAKGDAGEVSICLELPHVSPVDRQRFLEDPTQATHFNPVFVAAELPTHHHAYDIQNCPFWILAEKIHRAGEKVVYHEIVLYEILGNSLTANVMFPEIPRLLFNPHKTLLDGLASGR